MKPRFLVAMAVLALLTVASLSARASAAQANDVRAIYLSAATVPTNVAGVNTYPDPPKGFNPLTANAFELARYGFPQRPDKEAEPDHYAMWDRAMLAAKNRWHGELKQRDSSSWTMALSSAATTPPPPVATPSNNYQASGVILNNGATKWGGSSFYDLWTTITVPVVQLPFGNASCAADGNYYSLSLAGFDGLVAFSPATGHALFLPGEFAGVIEAVNCFSGATLYENVFGWNYNLNDSFFLNPGDVFYTEVHAFGGCNSGSAFVEDLTTLTFNSFTIPNPCGLPQTGRYANWIVARPPFANGGIPDELSPLANTLQISFNGGEVLNASGKPFYPGSQATSTTVLTMHDDNNTQSIELVNQGSGGYQGLHSLWFQTTGCAFSGGCTP